MIDFFYDYGKGIAVFLIFIAFIEMLLPNNNYKRYINIVTGFLIILALINPFCYTFDSLYENFERGVFFADLNIKASSWEKNEKAYTQKQKELIFEELEKDIHSHITELLGDKAYVEKTEVIFDENEFGKIKELDITLRSNEEKAFFRIEDGDKEENYIKNIKSVIADFYKLELENINIRKH